MTNAFAATGNRVQIPDEPVTVSRERFCRRPLVRPHLHAANREGAGGSNVAAAICNALLYTAAGMLDPHRCM